MFALAFVFLGGCRTVEENELDGWQNYSATMAFISDSTLWPQSAVWRMGTESGSGRVPKPAAGLTIAIALWDPPADTLRIELRKGEIRYARGTFVFAGSTRLKLVDQELDTVASEIFRRIHPRTDASTFDSTLAQALVDGDTLVKHLGFPANHPDGIDTAKVFRRAMLIMVAKGIPLYAIAKNWLLGVDTLQIHSRIRILCEQGTVTDTSKIFPHPLVVVLPAPDRDGPNIFIASPSAGATFAFEQDSLVVEASVTDSSRVDSVWVNSLAMSKSGDAWRSPRLFLPAADSGAWIVVRARDGMGNASVASVKVYRLSEMEVVPLPRPKALTKILSPAAGQFLSFDSAQVHVVWKIVRPFSALDRVWANGIAAERLSDSTWGAAVAVPPTGARFLVRLEAMRGDGDTLVDSVAVVRSRDLVAPVLKRVAGSRGVGVDSAWVFVSWAVSDNHKLATVSVNGTAVSGVGGIYGDRIALSPGSNLVRITATDSSGNSSIDSVVVVRGAKDTIPPVLQRAAGTNDRTVAADTSAVVLVWSAVDSSLAVVEIGGVVIAGNQDQYGRLTFLVPGRNVVYVQAFDSTGNVSTDSVVIVRLFKDSLQPVVARLAGTVDRTVRFDSARVSVGWNVADAALRNVTIAGAPVLGASGRYEAQVELAIGRNVVRIRAVDSTGNLATDSVIIYRVAKDSTPPILVRAASTVDRTVPFDSTIALVEWRVSDASLKSVALGSAGVEGKSGTFSANVALVVGSNVVRIRAVDSAGNSTTDSVVIVRLARDSIAPVVVRSPGTFDRKVRFDTARTMVSWTVADAALRTVSIGGIVVQGSNGTYFVSTGLSVGRNVLGIVAIDSAGNRATDSVVIDRLEKDTTAPRLVRLPGTDSRVLRFDSLSAIVSWRVSDEALSSVTIEGDTIQGADRVYSKSISVLGSSRGVRIVATDSSGNVSRDSILLSKGVDSLPPVLSKVPGTIDTTVSSEIDSFAVHWSAIDDGVLQSVLINGVEAIADGSLFFRNVPLVLGTNTITIEAYDGAGHVATDTIQVVRLRSEPNP